MSGRTAILGNAVTSDEAIARWVIIPGLFGIVFASVPWCGGSSKDRTEASGGS